jgi:D-alanine-D-alanine ligase
LQNPNPDLFLFDKKPNYFYLKLAMSKKIKVAVLTGGEAAELEVSLKSAEVVATNLDKQKYEVYKVDITHAPWKASDKDGEYTIDLNDFTFQKNSKKVNFDVVFVAIHGTPAEDGKIQGYFDLLKIPYTCCSPLASAITFDKDICKQLIASLDVYLAKSVLVTPGNIDEKKIAKKLDFPVFVKPNKNGSSFGVSKVKDKKDLSAAISKALEYDDEVLVEEFIKGRELGCGVVEKDGELIALPVTEIISENEFFDYEAKYQGKSKELTPAPLTEKQMNKCHKMAKKIYRLLKLKGAVRIDFFLKGNDLYLLEVNTVPGLSAESILPQQAQAYGWTLPEFFDIIISETLKSKRQ